MYGHLIRVRSGTPDARVHARLMTRGFFDGFFTQPWQMLTLSRGDEDIALPGRPWGVGQCTIGGSAARGEDVEESLAARRILR